MGRILSMIAGALVITLIPLATAQARALKQTSPRLEKVADFGPVYYDLSGRKGVVLCFHGAGGSAEGWTKSEKAEFLADLKQLGYSFVCPTSVNRSTKKWNTNNWHNRDVDNIDGLLTHLGISSRTRIFVVGHSNGGGFATRFSVLSARAPQIKAVQYSNSAGLAPAFQDPDYNIPSLFNYATCDQVADASRAVENADLLASAHPRIRTMKNDITALYAGRDPRCHEFINTSSTTAEFFRQSRNSGQ